jgi:hypothetical protein
MKVFGRNMDGSRGPLLADTDDPRWIERQERREELRAIQALASDRLLAVRLRIALGRFGHDGGRHRELPGRLRRTDPARLLYRLITG